MPGILRLTLWAISVVPFVFITATLGGAPQIQSVLNRAAEEVQVEISLGQLAAQRSINTQVKEFGQHMVEDHKKASQQLELLALKQNVKLSPGKKHEHQTSSSGSSFSCQS